MPDMPKYAFQQRIAPNLFFFLPRCLLERLTAAFQGSGVPPPKKKEKCLLQYKFLAIRVCSFRTRLEREFLKPKINTKMADSNAAIDDEAAVFTVRRYALHGICYNNSVCPSVRPSVCLSHSWTVSTWFDLRS